MSARRLAEEALAEIDSENFARARDLARDAISQNPRDAAGLRALGLAEFRLGKHKDAVEALRRSLRIDPSQAPAHLALANVLQDQGQIDSAITSYRRALRLEPDSAQAHNDLGTALYARGNLEEAIREFEEALKSDPRAPMTYENLGSALRRVGRFAQARRVFSRSLWLRITQGVRTLLRLERKDARARAAGPAENSVAHAIRLHAEGKLEQALEICEKLLAENPDNAEALHMKGLALVDRDAAAAALFLLERAVALQPRIPEFSNSLGICLRKLGRTTEALDAYARAIELNRNFVQAYLNLAQLSADLEIFDQAERAARAALTIEPELIAARHTLARALQGQGKYEELERTARETLALDSGQVDSWLYLGQALRERNRLDEAWDAFSKALQLGPDVPMVHLTIGVFLLECRRDAAGAIRHYRRARPFEAPLGSSCFNESLTRFATGDYSRESWDLYEARRSQGARAAAYKKIPLPEWQGPADPDRDLLVYGEQGIGDEIMFSSMVPEAAGLVRRCVLACDPRLLDLFARSFPKVVCVAWPRANLEVQAPELHGSSVAIPIGSLGRYFRDGAQKFSGRQPFLVADPAKVEAWRRRLREIGPPPYLGLAWEGGLWTSGRARRSLSLARLAPHLQGIDARWVSLQLGASAALIAHEARTLAMVHWQDALDSVDDSAALIAALDGVVSVCSWIVHLSGALGRPVTVLAPFAPEWRYGLSASGMMWYPGATMLRQRSYGDWDSVLAELRSRLVSGAL
jgi:tetratricopeptide (TPR) repeat protein